MSSGTGASIEYALSAYDQYVVAREDASVQFTPLRQYMVIIEFAVGVLSILHWAVLTFLRCRKQRSAPSLVLVLLSVLYVKSIACHAWHYCDNIYRPVSYFEPKWLYDRYLFSQMELTFYFSLPMIYLSTVGLQRVLGATDATAAAAAAAAGAGGAVAVPSVEASNAAAQSGVSGCLYLFVYSAMSLVSVMHYRVHPISGYAASVNGSIITESVAAIALGAFVFWLRRKFQRMIKVRVSGSGGSAVPSADRSAEMANLLPAAQ